MLRTFLICLGAVFLSGCAAFEAVNLPVAIGEKEFRPDVRDQIAYRVQWLGPEQEWHYNCLFGKPIQTIAGGEQQIILPVAESLLRAHWEEERRSYHSAGFLWRQTADRGIALSFAKLGQLLIEGKGTRKNLEGGGKLLEQSARLDCAYGQYLYADFITKGRGVRSNLLEAYAWAALAKDQGIQEASPIIDRIAGILGPSQLAVAQQNTINLRQQLNLFNQGEQGRKLVNCITDRSPRPFVTRLRVCSVMEGRAEPLTRQLF